VLNQRCRIVAILGIAGVGKTGLSLKLGRGGIGKTDLSLKVARGLAAEFDAVIWSKWSSACLFLCHWLRQGGRYLGGNR